MAKSDVFHTAIRVNCRATFAPFRDTRAASHSLPLALYFLSMSLSEALGPIHVTPKLEPVGNNPAGSDDVEMNVTGSTLVPKTELDRTTPKEDAEMEDLFGNDDDLDAKGDDDEMKGQRCVSAARPSLAVQCIDRLLVPASPVLPSHPGRARKSDNAAS